MRGWIALGVSILALLLSATTAYFANFLEVDDLRVLTSVDPSNKEGNPYMLPGIWQAVFINNGTRPISVVNVFATIGDEARGDLNLQCGKPFLFTDTAGFVVPEKEIVRKTISLKPVENKPGKLHVTSDHNIQFPSGADEIEGNLCLSAQLATVSKADIFADIHLTHYKLTQNGIEQGFMGQRSPQTLWHSTKFIFQSD